MSAGLSCLAICRWKAWEIQKRLHLQQLILSIFFSLLSLHFASQFTSLIGTVKGSIEKKISFLYPSLHTTAHSARLNTSHPIHTRYTTYDSLISARAILRQTTCFSSQSPWFFWRSPSCVTVCQVIKIRALRSPPSAENAQHSFHTCQIYSLGWNVTESPTIGYS